MSKDGCRHSRLVCPSCGAKLNSINELIYKMAKWDYIGDGRYEFFDSDYCDEPEQPFQCPYCGEVFSNVLFRIDGDCLYIEEDV